MSSVVVVAASSAQTTTGFSAAVPTPAGENLILQLSVTAASGTTPSATFTVQWTQDGINWADTDTTADGFAAVTTVVNKVKQFPVKGEQFRLAWAITGTTPSFTFKASAFVTGARSDS